MPRTAISPKTSPNSKVHSQPMFCQKCRTPLSLDGSLNDLHPASFRLLADTARSAQNSTPVQSRPSNQAYPRERLDQYEAAQKKSQSPALKRNVASDFQGRRDNSDMSFIMLSDSQIDHASSSRTPENAKSAQSQEARLTSKKTSHDDKTQLSDKMEKANRLFEIMSSRTDIDHPICVECTEILVDGLQKRLNAAMKERDSYVEYLRQANAEIPSEREKQQAEEELSKAREREKEAFEMLEKLEKEKADMDKELEDLENQTRELDLAEEQFWRERNAVTDTLSTFQKERDRVQAKFDHDSKQLERLQRTNVFNDTFNIGHDGYFGTINGLRLGRLSTITVDWAEINAAWGQTCLLLATVAERLGFIFQGYKLNPMGSSTTIERHEYPQSSAGNDPAHPAKPRITILELYCGGDLPLGLGFLHRRFDNAMVAFLECLRQLGEFVEHSPASETSVQALKLPYEIKKDKINDISIKLGGFSNEEPWTKACKYTLTCCKYLLAHASNLNAVGRA